MKSWPHPAESEGRRLRLILRIGRKPEQDEVDQRDDAASPAGSPSPGAGSRSPGRRRSAPGRPPSAPGRRGPAGRRRRGRRAGDAWPRWARIQQACCLPHQPAGSSGAAMSRTRSSAVGQLLARSRPSGRRSDRRGRRPRTRRPGSAAPRRTAAPIAASSFRAGIRTEIGGSTSSGPGMRGRSIGPEIGAKEDGRDEREDQGDQDQAEHGVQVGVLRL